MQKIKTRYKSRSEPLIFYNLKNDPMEAKSLSSYWSMSVDERNNYDYLCAQYVQLTNSTLPCLVTGVNDFNKESLLKVFPNPFTKHIQIENLKPNFIVELFNSIGVKIYAGTQIELQDFSNLTKGIYFIKIENSTYKIVKQ